MKCKSIIDSNFNIIHVLAIIIISCSCSSGSSTEITEETTEPPKSMLEEKTAVDPMENIGIGPATSVTLDEIDSDLAAEGAKIFETMCTACHKIDKKFIGPSPKGIFERRNPVWVMNMILNPEEMIKNDPIAKQLFIEANGAPMANQNLTEAQARAVLEYFRTL